MTVRNPGNKHVAAVLELIDRTLAEIGADQGLLESTGGGQTTDTSDGLAATKR